MESLCGLFSQISIVQDELDNLRKMYSRLLNTTDENCIINELYHLILRYYNSFIKDMHLQDIIYKNGRDIQITTEKFLSCCRNNQINRDTLGYAKHIIEMMLIDVESPYCDVVLYYSDTEMSDHNESNDESNDDSNDESNDEY